MTSLPPPAKKFDQYLHENVLVGGKILLFAEKLARQPAKANMQ